MRFGLFTTLVVAAAVSAPATAAAQAPGGEAPEFKFGEKEDVDGVEWKASVQAGLVATTGNARNTTLTGGAKLSRKERANKFSLAANGSFARSSVFIAVDQNADGVLDASEFERDSITTAESWDVTGRYDRFLTARGSVYLLGTVGADRPAGKELVAGGQLGYSRELYKDEVHALTGELGYDFTYESLVAGGDPLAIHSGRAFAGYAAQPREGIEIKASGEALVNVNRLDTAAGEVGPGEDTRLIGLLEANASVTDKVSVSASFKARYDSAPAPLPPFDIPFAPGFVPLAEELDTTTKVSLIINFL